MGRLQAPNPPSSANERTLFGFTIDGPFTGLTGTTVTLSAPATAGLVLAYKNGVLLNPSTAYTLAVSGTTLTLTVAAVNSDWFVVVYWARGAR